VSTLLKPPSNCLTYSFAFKRKEKNAPILSFRVWQQHSIRILPLIEKQWGPPTSAILYKLLLPSMLYVESNLILNSVLILFFPSFLPFELKKMNHHEEEE